MHAPDFLGRCQTTKSANMNPRRMKGGVKTQVAAMFRPALPVGDSTKRRMSDPKQSGGIAAANRKSIQMRFDLATPLTAERPARLRARVCGRYFANLR